MVFGVVTSVVVVVLVLALIWYVWFRQENLTDSDLAQALIAQAIIQDPQNSAAIIRAMNPKQRAKYETMVPYNNLANSKFVTAFNA